MVADASLLNTQYYKVRITSKVEQSRERSSAPPLHLDVVAIEKGDLGVTLDYGRQLYFTSNSYIYIKQNVENVPVDNFKIKRYK